MVEKDCEKIYSLGYSFIMLSSFFAVFLGIGSYLMFKYTRNDTYLICIIGALISTAIFYIIRYIVNNNDYDDIYELNKGIFGKFLGRILNIILLLGFILMASIILFNNANFFNAEYLPDTSINFLKAIILLPLVYISSKSLASIIKMNQVLCIINIFMLFLSIIGVFAEFDITNLEPVFNASYGEIFKSIVLYVVLSIVPLSMLLVCSRKRIADSERLNGNLLKSFVFTNILQFLIVLITILVLGEKFISLFRFPEHIALKQFNLFNIFQRVENFLALQFYFSSFSLMSFLFYYIIKAMPSTKFRNYYSILISIFLYFFTNIIFNNTVIFTEMIDKYIIYVILITIFAPILAIFAKLIMQNKFAKIDKK